MRILNNIYGFPDNSCARWSCRDSDLLSSPHIAHSAETDDGVIKQHTHLNWFFVIGPNGARTAFGSIYDDDGCRNVTALLGRGFTRDYRVAILVWRICQAQLWAVIQYLPAHLHWNIERLRVMRKHAPHNPVVTHNGYEACNYVELSPIRIALLKQRIYAR